MLNHYHTTPTFYDYNKDYFEKTLWEKNKNAGDQYFLLFPQSSLLYQREIVILATFNMSSENASILVMFGKELMETDKKHRREKSAF